MRIRAVQPEDMDPVVALAARLTEGVASWRDQDHVAVAVRQWLINSVNRAGGSDSSAFVAEEGGVVIGFVSVSERAHFTGELDAYVGELVVHKAHAGSGVGRALMRVAEDWARTRGLGRLMLETGAANAAARAFYEALGYELEDVRLSRGL